MKNQKTVELKPRKRKIAPRLNPEKQGFSPLVFRPSDLEVPSDNSLKEAVARKADNTETILPGSSNNNDNGIVHETSNHINKEFFWSQKDVKRYAGVYNKRLEEKTTPTRKVKAAFFNHILNNWEDFEQNGVVRVNPKEAKQWYSDKDDSIFSIDYRVPKD